MDIKILVWICLLLTSSKSFSQVTSKEEEVLDLFFQKKEVKKELTKYFGRSLCYQVETGSEEMILPFYNEISLDKKVCKSYIKEDCKNNNLVIFMYSKEENIIYLQIFNTNSKPHSYSDYPLTGNPYIGYFKIEIDSIEINSISKFIIIQG